MAARMASTSSGSAAKGRGRRLPSRASTKEASLRRVTVPPRRVGAVADLAVHQPVEPFHVVEIDRLPVRVALRRNDPQALDPASLHLRGSARLLVWPGTARALAAAGSEGHVVGPAGSGPGSPAR